MALASRRGVVAVCALLLALIIGVQGLASATAPEMPADSATRVVGRAGFAYLAGLRTFGAAVLWNRLEPQFHDYYEGMPLEKQVHILPTLRLVVALDPQFEQAYALGSFVLMKRGDEKTALSLARQGVENNPKSGFMRANLAQILLLQDPKANLAEMLEQTRIGLGTDMQWANADDFFEGVATFRTVYVLEGDNEKVEQLTAALEKLKASGELTEEDHDHDGDGKQDH